MSFQRVSRIGWLTLFVFLPVGLFGFIALKAFGYIRPIFRDRGKISADVTGRLTETLNGVRVIKGFNAEEQENKTFEEGVERLFLNVKKSLTATSLMTSSSTFLLGLASAGIMGMGGYFMMQNTMTNGDFVSFTLFLGFMIAPIVQMSNNGSQLTEALAGLDRTQELMQMQMKQMAEQQKQAAAQMSAFMKSMPAIQQNGAQGQATTTRKGRNDGPIYCKNCKLNGYHQPDSCFELEKNTARQPPGWKSVL